jgi:hypothetical protein
LRTKDPSVSIAVIVALPDMPPKFILTPCVAEINEAVILPVVKLAPVNVKALTVLIAETSTKALPPVP